MIATSTDGKLYRIVYHHTCLVHSKDEPKILEIEEIVRLHQSGINGLWVINSIKDSNGKPIRQPGLFKHVKGIGWFIKEYGIAVYTAQNGFDLEPFPW